MAVAAERQNKKQKVQMLLTPGAQGLQVYASMVAGGVFMSGRPCAAHDNLRTPPSEKFEGK